MHCKVNKTTFQFIQFICFCFSFDLQHSYKILIAAVDLKKLIFTTFGTMASKTIS